MEPAEIAADPTNMVKPGAPGDGLIFNPDTWSAPYLDAADEQKLKAMIEWFEDRGKQTLKDHDRENRWYSDFLEMQAEQDIFADFLTPEGEGGGDPAKRWDTQRICAFNEISAFYGLAYWYTWQVTILGLGPIFQSDNGEARRRAAELLGDGAIFAFGLS